MNKDIDYNDVIEEIDKKNDELRDLYKKRMMIKNHILNQVAGKIVDKIVKDKLYQNEDLQLNHVHIRHDPIDYSEGVFIKNYEDDNGVLEETNLQDDADVLSITFNIKYDSELEEIMNQDWNKF